MLDIGSAIKKIRIEKGLSQSQVGGSKYSRSFISGVEASRYYPSPQSLKDIAANLGEPLAIFIPYYTATNPTPKALIELSEILLDANEPSLAQVLLKQALKDRRIKRQRQDKIQAHYLIARIERTLGKLDLAEFHLDKSIKIAKNISAWEQVAKAEIGLAVLSDMRGDLLTAIRLTQSAQTHLLSLSKRDTDLLLESYSYMGNLLFSIGSNTLSYEVYHNAKRLLPETRNPKTKLRYLMGLALVSRKLHKYEEAFNANALALYQAYRIRDMEIMGDVYNNLGILLREKNDRRTLRCLTKSLNLLSQSKNTWKIGYVKNELALYYFSNNQIAQAEEFANHALNLLTDNSHIEEHVLSLEILGDIAFHKTEYIKANHFYNEALSLTENNIKQFNILTKQAMIHYAQKDFTKALMYYQIASTVIA